VVKSKFNATRAKNEDALASRNFASLCSAAAGLVRPRAASP